MSALICGSLAYDNIMVFHDRFKNHILPDKVHILNVSFMVPEMRREFGGCAGNIAYNLQLLGGKPVPMATVGRDFSAYAAWMEKWQINRKYIKAVSEAYTAQAFITTDLDDNQITAFHPGAMDHAHLNDVAEALRESKEVVLGIVSPDGRSGMLQHAARFAACGVPFIFDPGQGMPMFDGADLVRFLDQATWVTVNDYEWELMQERTGFSPGDVLEKVHALIVTRGSKGSEIYTREERFPVAPVRPREVVDPTGCGDAYRAGILFGLMNGLDWEATAQIASLMGAIKVEHHGTQNHYFERSEFEDRFQTAFSRPFPEQAK